MAEFNNVTLDEQLTFSPNTTSVIDLDRDKFVQDLYLRTTIDYDTAAGAPVLQEDNPLDLIQSIRVTANGETLYELAGKRLWYMNAYWNGIAGERNVTTTATSQSNVIDSFMLETPFKLNYRDPFDIGAVIPAQDLNQFQLHIGWGANANLATNTTINTATMDVTMREVTFSPKEIRDNFGANFEKLPRIRVSEKVQTVASSNTNFAFQVDVPTGNFIKNIGVFAVDNGVRDDDLISRWRLRRRSPAQLDITGGLDWESEQSIDRTENRMPWDLEIDAALSSEELWARPLRGYTFLNTEGFAGVLGGIDARLLKQGDLQFQASNAVPTGVSDVTLVNTEVVI